MLFKRYLCVVFLLFLLFLEKNGKPSEMNTARNILEILCTHTSTQKVEREWNHNSLNRHSLFFFSFKQQWMKNVFLYPHSSLSFTITISSSPMLAHCYYCCRTKIWHFNLLHSDSVYMNISFTKDFDTRSHHPQHVSVTNAHLWLTLNILFY